MKECFKKLFRKVEEGEPNTFMAQIIKRVWKNKKDIPKIQISFAISTCEVFLNPGNQYVTMSEKVIKNKIRKNLVIIK